MFSTLWHVITFQWGKVGLPTTDILDLSGHYYGIRFIPGKYSDSKQASKAFLRLVGGKGFKKVLEKSTIELLTPKQMYPQFIGPMQQLKYREDRHDLLNTVRQGYATTVAVQKEWYEKIVSEDCFLPDGKSLRLCSFGAVQKANMMQVVFHWHQLKTASDLKKSTPEECEFCSHRLDTIMGLYNCCYCMTPIPEVEKILKKSMGNKLFKAQHLPDEMAERVFFKELKRKKYRKFLQENPYTIYGGVIIRDDEYDSHVVSVEEDEDDDNW